MNPIKFLGRGAVLLGALLTMGCAQRVEPQPVAEPEPPRPLVSEVADSIYEEGCQAEVKPLSEAADSDFVVLADVVPDIIQEIRYYTTYNFVGRRVPGYEAPVALLTRRAADSLALVSQDLIREGYRLKVFDAYRPQRAVLYFIGWARAEADTVAKPYFYPEIDKADAFRLGYLAHRSGHSRGSTIDLTLFDMQTEREVDMGGTYDYFGPVSHYWCREGVTAEQFRRRALLRQAMTNHGFVPVGTEWWHFTLADEPYPDKYFDFPITKDVL